jgi:UMF1 family MFS transporter
VLFLAGYWLYIDGVGTIYKMAVFFANRILELPQESLITALLLTQFVAFPAALFFGWLGKRIGPKNGILIGLVVYVVVIFYAWGYLDSAAGFYKLAVAIGLVQGGVQSLSRSLFSRLIPRSKSTEFFGFYNMVGKFSSILGPLLMAIVPVVFANSAARDSILVLVLLFVLGGWILFKVNVADGIKMAKYKTPNRS